MLKYNIEELNRTMQEYVNTFQMPGAELIVSKGEEELYRNKWGYAAPEHKVPVQYNTIYRLCSMSKPITSIAVMQLAEQGELSLEDKISKYLPEYMYMSVVPVYIWPNGYYDPSEDFPAGMAQDKIIEQALTMKVPANREITIRDLLSHSSGIGMGGVGSAAAYSMIDPQDNLEARVNRWSQIPLDFQPGTSTGYSALVGHDILGRIIEIVSGISLNSYFKKNILDPLDIKDICYTLNNEQKTRIGKPYFAENGNLYLAANITQAPMFELMEMSINADLAGYYSGSAGLWGSCEDYSKIVKMLANEGILNGARILKQDTVQLMHTQACKDHLDPHQVGQNGCVWGLGVIIFEDASKMETYAAEGTFGWSGAYGTYMLIDPETKVGFTFMTSVLNSGGNCCPISLKTQEMIFNIWK